MLCVLGCFFGYTPRDYARDRQDKLTLQRTVPVRLKPDFGFRIFPCSNEELTEIRRRDGVEFIFPKHPGDVRIFQARSHSKFHKCFAPLTCELAHSDAYQMGLTRYPENLQ